MPEWSTLSPGQIVDGLREIVGAEGPMHAMRAYQLLIRATGGQRVGRELRRVLNQATARGLRQGHLAQLVDSISGQTDKTLYLPGTEPVIVRALGPRLLFEVPRSEVNALVQMLDLEGPSHVIHRGVLDALGLTRLTPRTRDYLDECLAYRWTPGD